MSKNKVITTQFKLIEMSQTRARGWIEKYILRKTKLPLIVHVSVSKKPNKWDNKRLSPFYYSSILTPSLTINTAELFAWFPYRLHDSLSCSLEVKSRLINYLFGCGLFLEFWFHFCYSVPFEKANIIRLESYS